MATLKSTSDPYISVQSKLVYVYEIEDKDINKNYAKYTSISKANAILEGSPARGTLAKFIDTNVSFRDKLYYTRPIEDFESRFNLVKNISSDLKVNSNKSQEVWAYNGKTLEAVKGSPFPSKHQAASSIGISRDVINYFIDTGKAEGIQGTYLFSRKLEDTEIKKLLESSQTLKLGNKVKVFAYDAKNTWNN